MASQGGCERALDPGPRDAVGANDIDHLEIPLVPCFHLQRREAGRLACYLGAFRREEVKTPAVTGLGGEKVSVKGCSMFQDTENEIKHWGFYLFQIIYLFQGDLGVAIQILFNVPTHVE